MDFAKEHLKKLGWQEGDGLGKRRHGMAEALKPKLKFDTSGVGHDPAKEFTHCWWSEAYNNVAKNISVTEVTDGCELVAKPRKKKKKAKMSCPTYQNFVAGGVLNGDHSTEDGAPVDNVAIKNDDESVSVQTSDEQLLAACGGRTAHKGARHGHKMDGKLARILAQEAKLLASVAGALDSAEPTGVPEKKKKRKRSDVSEVKSAELDGDLDDPGSDDDAPKVKKRGKQKHRDRGSEQAGADGAPQKKKRKPKHGS
ncbi:G patch domain-containing protein 4-like [Pollicipes pollicipes]|uniref:G patch domain-containing protein 4-like n=1 Tax=Pollicipes pollicipes TaxID=41117 RepID=UPI001885005D|nr:G patch domain-containing protein 4-like [Pollicipes pollicipes]XP_037072956.1 G patch domain-containing protein 4-like [Pollicipes pollicipes]